MKNKRQFASFKFQVFRLRREPEAHQPRVEIHLWWTSFKFQVANQLKVWSVFILILILIVPSICLSEIRGRLISKKENNPIPFAKIEFLPYNQITLSNENGYFSLESSEKEGKLKISSIGYKTKVIKISPNISSELLIKLEIEPIEISGIRVKGERISTLTRLSQNVEIVKSERINSPNLLVGLEAETGMVIQENSSGEKVISINGCSSKQVAVMIDGIRINTAGSNSFNIGQIPMEMVDRIEIVRNNASAIAGDAAIGGVINIITKSPMQMLKENSLVFTSGSWNKYKGNYLGRFPIKGTNILVNANLQKAKNDFEYYNKYEQKKVKRKNNGSIEKSLMIKTDTKINNDLSTYFSAFLQNIEKGTPGQINYYIYYENAKASAEICQFKNETHLMHNEYEVNLKSFYQKQKNHYKNLETHPNYKYNSRNAADLFDNQIDFNWEKKFYSTNFRIGLRVESYRYDNLLNKAVSIPKKQRTTFSFSNLSKSSVKNRWCKFVAYPSIRLDKILEDRSIVSTKLGLDILPKFSDNLSLSMGYGTSYRMPEFTTLFWKGDPRVQGNPNLMPEKSYGFDGKLNWNPNFMDISISGFSNKVSKLIYWYRSSPHGIWKPENLAEARVSGISGRLNLPIFDWLSFTASGTKFYPRNKTESSDHFGNYLPYRPLYKIHSSINIKIPKFSLSINYSNLGKQYENLSNTVKISQYKKADLMSKFSQNLGIHFGFEMTLWINNLFNERYELYRNIPASGRNYETKLQIKYQK